MRTQKFLDDFSFICLTLREEIIIIFYIIVIDCSHTNNRGKKFIVCKKKEGKPKMKYIGHKIRIVSNMIKRYTDDNLRLPRSKDITTMVIGFLYESELEKKEVFQKDIREKFGMSRSAVTGLVDRMEEKGLVVRKKAQKDGRLKKVVLTKKCRETCDVTFAALKSLEDMLVKGFSEKEKDTLMTLLEKVYKNIISAEEKTDGTGKEEAAKDD